MTKPNRAAIGETCTCFSITFENKAAVACANKRASRILATLFAAIIGIVLAFVLQCWTEFAVPTGKRSELPREML
jgi:hypothetical protein